MTDQQMHDYPEHKPRFFYGYVIAMVAFVIQFSTFGPRMSFGVFFKPLLGEFGWSRALISGAFSLSSIMEGTSGVVMGALNDRFGPRRVITLCGLFVGLGYILMCLTDSAWQLYLFYVVFVGIGMGGSYVPILSTVARWFSKRRSMITGIVIAGGGISSIAIPPVINYLISIYGWRNSYIIMGGFVLLVIVISSQFLKYDPSKMGLKPYGYAGKGEHELDLNARGLTMKEATRTRQLWMAVLMSVCFGISAITVTVHIVPHATDLGFSSATAANILATRGAAGLLGCISLGWIADRIGNRPTYIICFTLISAALFWLVTASQAWEFFTCAVIIGLGGGGLATLSSPLIAELFGIRGHGMLLGFSGFGYTIGAAAGPFIAGRIFDVTGSYQSAFITCAIVAILGLILAAMLRPVKTPVSAGL